MAFFSSELWRVVTLSSECGRFTETAEQVRQILYLSESTKKTTIQIILSLKEVDVDQYFEILINFHHNCQD